MSFITLPAVSSDHRLASIPLGRYVCIAWILVGWVASRSAEDACPRLF